MSKPLPQQRMTVEEFLDWAQTQEMGRYELDNGRVVAMSPEQGQHLRVKGAAFIALSAAIKRAGVPCEAFPDGATVRIDAHTAFEPDASVNCGERMGDTELIAPNPVIVVEVLSPSTERRDHAHKLANYFRVPSIEHYLIIDPETRRIVHYKRGGGDVLETRIVAAGASRLEPPGLEIAVEDVFAGLA
jgi:Uma2 family endonuclease